MYVRYVLFRSEDTISDKWKYCTPPCGGSTLQTPDIYWSTSLVLQIARLQIWGGGKGSNFPFPWAGKKEGRRKVMKEKKKGGKIRKWKWKRNNKKKSESKPKWLNYQRNVKIFRFYEGKNEIKKVSNPAQCKSSHLIRLWIHFWLWNSDCTSGPNNCSWKKNPKIAALLNFHCPQRMFF